MESSMRQSRAHGFDASEFWRSLPLMLGALLSVVAAVDILLAFQPALLGDLSRAFRSSVTMRPFLAPSADVLAAALAVGAVVITSAVLLAFARATLLAPQFSLAPAWVALCMLSMTRVAGPLPLPVSISAFAALSGLLLVGGGAALRQGSRAGMVFGWLLIALPLVVFGASYATASHTAYPFGRAASMVLTGLTLSAVGAVLAAHMSGRARSAAQVADLEGVDVVDELFAQVERAERSEARVAELERQLRAQRGDVPSRAR
jgi:hypothetical protein